MRRAIAVAASTVALLVVVLPVPVVLAARLWTLTASPLAITSGDSEAVTLTVTNIGGGGGGDEIACVTIDVPSSFGVEAVAIVSIKGETSAGVHGWQSLTSSTSDGTRVTFKEPNDRNVLVGLPSADEAVFRITGTAHGAGVLAWIGGATDKPGKAGDPKCGSGTFPALAISLSVLPGPTPTPTPRPTPTPTPRPTSKPTDAPTPRPTDGPTPTPARTPSPEPTGAATPVPVATDAPRASPTPSATASPTGQPSVAPTPTPGADAGGPAGPTDKPRGSNRPGPAASGRPVLSAPIVVGGTGGDAGARPTMDGLDSAVTSAFMRLGLASWGVPAVVMGVPGLLVVLVVLLQLAGGAAWLPVARRALGGIGLRRRRPNSAHLR